MSASYAEAVVGRPETDIDFPKSAIAGKADVSVGRRDVRCGENSGRWWRESGHCRLVIGNLLVAERGDKEMFTYADPCAAVPSFLKTRAQQQIRSSITRNPCREMDLRLPVRSTLRDPHLSSSLNYEAPSGALSFL